MRFRVNVRDLNGMEILFSWSAKPCIMPQARSIPTFALSAISAILSQNGLSNPSEALSIVARPSDTRSIVVCSGYHRSILLFVISAASSFPRTATPLSSALPAGSLGGGGGLACGWAHESEVDIDGLLEELLSIAALDRGLCFAHGRELNESVSLCPVISPTSHALRGIARDVLCPLHSISSYLDVSRSAIQVHVHILDLPKVAKQILQVLLRCFLVDVGDDDDPALDAADRYGVLGGLTVANGVVGLAILIVRVGRVDLHLGVGHLGGM